MYTFFLLVYSNLHVRMLLVEAEEKKPDETGDKIRKKERKRIKKGEKKRNINKKKK